MSRAALPAGVGEAPERIGLALLLLLPAVAGAARALGLRIEAADTGPDMELFAALFAVALLLFPAFDRLVRLPRLEPLRAFPFSGWMVARGSLLLVMGGAVGAAVAVALLRADLPPSVTLGGALFIGLVVPAAALGVLLLLLVAVTDSGSGLGRSLDLDARKPSRTLVEQAPGIAITAALIGGLLAWLAVRDLETRFLQDGAFSSPSRAAQLVGGLALFAGPLQLLNGLRGWQREVHRILARCYDFDRMFDDLAMRQQAREAEVEVPPLDSADPLTDALTRSWLRTPALRLGGSLALGAAAAAFAAARGVPLVAAAGLSAMLLVGALPTSDWRFAGTRAWLTAHGVATASLALLERRAELQRAAGWLPLLLLAAVEGRALLPTLAAALVHVGVGLLATRAPRPVPALLRLPLVLAALALPLFAPVALLLGALLPRLFSPILPHRAAAR